MGPNSCCVHVVVVLVRANANVSVWAHTKPNS